MLFFFSSRRRHTRFDCDWSSDVCSSDLTAASGHFATMGISPDLMEGARIATRGMIQWLVEEHGVTREDAYVLCSVRSEERRVGEEGRSRWAPYHLKKKKNKGINIGSDCR